VVKNHSVFSDDRGMALVAVLLILMAVALMGVGLSADSSMDVRIAGYQKYKAVSFGFAESSLYATTDVLEANNEDGGWANDNIAYPHISNVYATTLGSTILVVNRELYLTGGDVEYGGLIRSSVAVTYEETRLGEGEAIQMAAGYEGVGKGAGGGGVHVIYDMIADGVGVENITTRLGIGYRHVTK